MFSFQMIEKLKLKKKKKKKDARFHNSNRTLLFSGFYFFRFWGRGCCLSLHFVQITAEAGKITAATDTQHVAIIGLFIIYIFLKLAVLSTFEKKYPSLQH
jgi:hypothetical protein